MNFLPPPFFPSWRLTVLLHSYLLTSKRSKCVRNSSLQGIFISRSGPVCTFNPLVFVQPVLVAATVDEGGLGGGGVTFA